MSRSATGRIRTVVHIPAVSAPIPDYTDDGAHYGCVPHTLLVHSYS